MVRHRIRFADYLRAWERERAEVLKWYDPLVMRYPASIAVTWKQTFDRLSPTPATLLRLIAFLAPDPIPVDMFEQGVENIQSAAELFCEEAGKSPDGKTIREAMADLTDYSLITRQDDGMLVVHRMVQEALRSQIPQEQRKEWNEEALWVVNGAAVGDPSDVRMWPLWDRLRPHVAGIVALADEMGIIDPTTRLMGDLANLLFAKSLYSEAEILYRRALEIAEASFDSEPPRIAIHLNNLAQLLLTMNRLEEAEPLMRRALSIDEHSSGSKHSTVAIRLNNLAQLLQATNRLEEAEPLMRRALAIDEHILGSQHPDVALDLNNLAGLLQATNRLGEAEPLRQRALSIAEDSFGPQHPIVATYLNNLARLLQSTNRLEEAEPLLRRSLDIDKAAYGNQHLSVARDLNNLALLLQATNRLEEAEPLMRRAIEISDKSLGPEHPKTQLARTNLEILLAEMSSAAPSEDNPDP